MIKVDYAALEQGAGAMKTIAGEIEGIIQDLKGKLAKVEWTGSDQAAYQEQQEAMQKSIDDIQQLLAQIGGAVQQAKDNYQMTEQSNAGNWA